MPIESVKLPTNQYIIKLKEKNDKTPPTIPDAFKAGQIAGLCGANTVNPRVPLKTMPIGNDSFLVTINDCTTDLFESKLNHQGIKFDRLV